MLEHSLVISGKKICRDCGIKKSVSEFSRTGAGYIMSYCKPCICIRNKIRRSKDPEKYSQHKKDTAKKLAEQNKKIKIENCIKFLEDNGYAIRASSSIHESSNTAAEFSA